MQDNESTENEASKPTLTIDAALKMFDQYKNYWEDNYRESKIDLLMYVGDRATHWGSGWDDAYRAPPIGSPALVINELPQYVHQVTNDIRQNVPSLKALPVADADIETGEIIAGLFRSIEDCSHADEVVDTAAEYAVKCAIGFMRVDHQFTKEDGEVQEIIFKMVPDPLSNYLDPASVEYDGRDANGAISLEPINKADFDRLYPGKQFISFTEPEVDNEKKESIVLAEIFIREKSGENDNDIIIRRYKCSGTDILNETTFPGFYIPLVPIYGEVTWVNGKRKVSSLIRNARDAQRRLNHWAGKESQILSMAPVAPIMAVRGTLANERNQWQKPGEEMILEYDQKDLNGDPAPQPTRLQPAQVPTGVINAMAGAKEDIKESMGIYNAGLGKREGDASGVALQALDRSGDIATFHYPDNVRRSYGHMGEIVIGMIPTIYDTPRIIQTLNDEADVEMVGINGAPLQPGQKQAYDLTKGSYRVRVTTGASYTTRRQEEAAFLQEAFKQDPQLMQIGGDILFKSMDMPGAQAMAARLKKMLPPQLQDDNMQQDPQVVQLSQKIQQLEQIIQQGAQEMGTMKQQLDNKNTEYQLKRDELLLKNKDLDIKARQVELQYGPAADTQSQLMEHHLDEQAADNQLARDLFQSAITPAISPQLNQQPEAQNGNSNQ